MGLIIKVIGTLVIIGVVIEIAVYLADICLFVIGFLLSLIIDILKSIYEFVKSKVRNKPKCYGYYIWAKKCNDCEFIDKCLEIKNSRIDGNILKYTNKHIPSPIKVKSKEK